jgi:carbon-monoxide dehydrogenase medium subunit
MIRTALRYHRPDSLIEASDIIGEFGDAVVLGGGTTILPRMGRHEIVTSHIVDLRGLGLGTVLIGVDEVRIGAMATYSQVARTPDVNSAAPLLAELIKGVTGGRQLLNLATLVGSACYNNPASDIPGALVALNARVEIHGLAGVRQVGIGEFFLDAYKVDLRPGEFVTAVSFSRSNSEVGYHKTKHASGSWPIATASAVFDRDAGSLVVTLGAVQAVPLVVDCSAAVTGADVRLSTVEQIVQDSVISPWTDILAPGDYRRIISGSVARKAVEEMAMEKS